MNDVGTGIRCVDRALSILEVLARDSEAGVTELADELGVNKSTAWRMLATLRRHRIVEQSGDRGKYRLGVGLLRLAEATAPGPDLLQEAQPVCRRLAADTGGTVRVSVRSETSAFCLDQVAGPSVPPPRDQVGRHFPLHATSGGKVLLAGLEDGELAEMLGVLSGGAPLTTAEKAELRAELGHVRALGYAVTADEGEADLTAVAAPVRDARGDVIAALSVSAPAFPLAEGRVESVAPLVLTAAAEVSHRLGVRVSHTTSPPHHSCASPGASRGE
ncbi:IclR family transcriptional regulator [Streptomyces sp. NPDC005811]|uniref:IclR family transcriptional regulator n=1 Tax=Streptomyces sp. NPDC005811 TaxID=3154565 RepID=UPI0033DE4AD1